MAKTRIPEKIQRALWARAGGRCQYRGCNCELIGDLLSGHEDKMFGFVAHIIADSPDGTRGDPILSPALAKDVSNLMLLCSKDHRLIDDEAPDDHSVELLREMKAEHENRIRLVSGIDRDRASHVIRFGANIGQNEALVAKRELFAAMLPERHPETFQMMDLEIVGSALRDDEAAYWSLQQNNLQRMFAQQMQGRIERQEIRHASVFALAPQPLLIELGRLLGDILPATIHQRHREPSTWRWQRDGDPIQYQVDEGDGARKGIALVLALSATITDDRIFDVLGPDADIWAIRAAAPHNDILRHPEDLAEFRCLLRGVFDRLKAKYGEGATINVFPALPVSAAVEVGRVWMPKADLPLRIFDQNRTAGGFIHALDIRSIAALEAISP